MNFPLHYKLKYSTIEQIMCFMKIEINNLKKDIENINKIELNTPTKIDNAYQDIYLINQEIEYYNEIINFNDNYKITKCINFNKKMKKPIKIKNIDYNITIEKAGFYNLLITLIQRLKFVINNNKNNINLINKYKDFKKYIIMIKKNYIKRMKFNFCMYVCRTYKR